MILDIIFLIMASIMIVVFIIYGIWRATCFFRKSCNWKSCPYRQPDAHSFFSGISLDGCSKFPLTQEEIDQYNKKLDDLLERISNTSRDE